MAWELQASSPLPQLACLTARRLVVPRQTCVEPRGALAGPRPIFAHPLGEAGREVDARGDTVSVSELACPAMYFQTRWCLACPLDVGFFRNHVACIVNYAVGDYINILTSRVPLA